MSSSSSSSSSSRQSRRGPPVHNSSKMINCNHCEASFARPEHLERHLLVHTSPKPFSCLQCHQSFSRRETLKRHYYDSHEHSKSTGPDFSVSKNISSTSSTTTGPQYFVYTPKSGDQRPQLSLRIPSTSEGIADVTKYMLSTAHPEESWCSGSSCCSSAYTDIAISPLPTTKMLGWSSSQSQSTTSMKQDRRSNYSEMSG